MSDGPFAPNGRRPAGAHDGQGRASMRADRSSITRSGRWSSSTGATPWWSCPGRDSRTVVQPSRRGPTKSLAGLSPTYASSGPWQTPAGRDLAEAGRAGLRVRGVRGSGQDDRVEPAIEPQGGRLGRLAGHRAVGQDAQPQADGRQAIERLAGRRPRGRSPARVPDRHRPASAVERREATSGNASRNRSKVSPRTPASKAAHNQASSPVDLGGGPAGIAGDRGEPAAHVVPLEIEGVVHIEDDAADHHFGRRTKRSALARVM